jgi:ABC-type multidrug transport system ATPase subunit
MNYWLVRAKWGVANKKAEFINNDEWINGYNDKYLEIVKRVETEDILLLAEDSTVTHYGKCIDNPQDGKHLSVDKWEALIQTITCPVKYSKAIAKISNDLDFKKEIALAISVTTYSQDVKITSIEIENFTVFKKENLEFSESLNIVIGENGLGKTHLLKLLAALVSSYNLFSFNIDFKSFTDNLKITIQSTLNSVFKADYLHHLISNREVESNIKLNMNSNYIGFSINSEGEVTPSKHSISSIGKRFAFIPAKEILSFYEGFIPLHENRETSFDEIYYNLARSLSLPVLKNIEYHPVEYKVLLKLEEILEGKIVLENGRFYLLQNNRKTEISLIAEGFRKIGMIAQLLANGSLNKNSILFWDEPETNLNPRLIRKMAEVLVELSRAGMQIFIATHSLFLVKEIEILRNKQDKVKYFSLGLNEDKEVRVSQSEEFEYLEDIVILDEELAQDDRFLTKEEG